MVKSESAEKWSAPVFPKSIHEARTIRRVLQSDKFSLLFRHLDPRDVEIIVLSVFKQFVPQNTELIKQGDEGDNFYIVEEGHFDIFVERNGKPAEKVCEAKKGDAFGELALLYGLPRAATCKASKPSEVWCLGGQTFRMMLITAENTKMKKYHDFLGKVEIFKPLNRYETNQLSDMLEAETFTKDAQVIKQGEMGDRFYLVEKGELECRMKEGDGPELTVKTYTAGNYFGEVSLICSVPRKASVYVKSKSADLLSIDKESFDRVLRPIMDILKNYVEQYPSYKEFLRKN